MLFRSRKAKKMINKNTKLAYILAVIIGLILIVSAIYDIQGGNRSNFYLYLIISLSITLPFIITYICNNKKINLPKSFQSTTLIIIFLAQYFGEIRKFYLRIWWWDLLIHAISGSYLVIIAINSMKNIIRKEQNVSNKRYLFITLLFSFNFSITLGTLWEIFEFLGDYLFETNMIKGGVEDTATDLIAHILAAFITTITIHYYEKNNIIDRKSVV